MAGGCGLWTGWNNVAHYTVAEQQAFDGAQVMCKLAHATRRDLDVQCALFLLAYLLFLCCLVLKSCVNLHKLPLELLMYPMLDTSVLVCDYRYVRTRTIYFSRSFYNTEL